MKLSVVVPVLNQVPMARAVYQQLRKATDMIYDDVEFLIIDNGSKEPLSPDDFPGAKIVRNEKSSGVYPTFKQGFEETTGEIVAFFHSDMIVWEHRWNERVVRAFEEHLNLGMLGFIGSNEIDSAGGRGLGTTSNFKGETLTGYETAPDFPEPRFEKKWSGSPAAAHGKVSDEYSPAAVIDGCSMIIRRSCYEGMHREDFPLHHFYDRLISTQMLERGFEIAVLGIACDHISGQTVNKESDYQHVAYQWLLMTRNPAVFNLGTSAPFNITHNYDEDIYRTAESMWLSEYRNKGYVPCRVS